MKKIILAIDPGKNGGWAWESMTGEVEAAPLPSNPYDMQLELQTIVAVCGVNSVVLEKVHSMPADGVKSAFAFGENYGIIQGVCAAYRLPVVRVAPTTWQKALGTMPSDKSARKHFIRDEMQRRYPHIKVTLKNADALGMLTAMMDKRKGD